MIAAAGNGVDWLPGFEVEDGDHAKRHVGHDSTEAIEDPGP
jgi:hypothetical protein